MLLYEKNIMILKMQFLKTAIILTFSQFVEFPSINNKIISES